MFVNWKHYYFYTKLTCLKNMPANCKLGKNTERDSKWKPNHFFLLRSKGLYLWILCSGFQEFPQSGSAPDDSHWREAITVRIYWRWSAGSAPLQTSQLLLLFYHIRVGGDQGSLLSDLFLFPLFSIQKEKIRLVFHPATFLNLSQEVCYWLLHIYVASEFSPWPWIRSLFISLFDQPFFFYSP